MYNMGITVSEVTPMASSEKTERDRQELQRLMDELYDEMHRWREEHPEASLDEIAREAVLRRRRLMAVWLEQLACQHGTGAAAEGLTCEKCGQPLIYKGRQRRKVEHTEAEIDLKRAYWYCPHCEGGIFPPGPPAAAG
jgi:predicted nuclease with RNAse H fold